LSVSLSYAEGVEEKLWSFKFKDCAVSDAFKQINQDQRHQNHQQCPYRYEDLQKSILKIKGLLK